MLELINVKKNYRKQEALQEICVSIQPGEIVGVLGKNGCGKSTLLKAILNLIDYEGSILWNKEPIRKQYERVAYISDELSLIPYHTPSQYSKFLKLYYPAFDEADFIAFCDRFQVPLDQKIETLSRGQQLKVELAAGYAQHAKLYVLDEPFTNLDTDSKELAVKMLLEILQGDEIVLLATHELALVETVFDRILYLQNGRIIDDVSMDSIYAQGKSLNEYLHEQGSCFDNIVSVI